MKRKKLLIGISVVVVLLVAFFMLSMPEQPEATASDRNTILYITLAEYGISDAVVDVSEGRTLIRYNLPEFMNKTDAIYYILGAAASIAPETEKISIQTYQNFEPMDEITISTKDVIDFSEGKISEDEFLKKIG